MDRCFLIDRQKAAGKNHVAMTPSQLRQWTIQNSQPDQWWLSLDGVTEEIPVTVAEIEERMKSGEYFTAQALHVSQASMAPPPWMEVAMPPMTKAPPAVPPIAATIKQEKTSATCRVIVFT